MRTTSMLVQALTVMRNDPDAGGQQQFWQLVERFRADLVNQAFSHLGNSADAEDAAQESLCLAFRRLGELKDPAKLGHWLRAVNRMNCMALRQKRARSRAREIRPPTAEYEALAAPESGAPEDSPLAEVARVVDRLPEAYREVIVLRYWEKMSCAQIAAHLGLPLNTAKTRLARADGLLLERLAERMRRPQESAGPEVTP